MGRCLLNALIILAVFVCLSRQAAVKRKLSLTDGHDDDSLIGAIESRLINLEERLARTEEQLSKQTRELRIARNINADQTARIELLEVLVRYHEERLGDSEQEYRRTGEDTARRQETLSRRNDGKAILAALGLDDGENFDGSGRIRNAGMGVVVDEASTKRADQESRLDGMEEVLNRHSAQLSLLLQEHNLDGSLRPLEQSESGTNNTSSASDSTTRGHWQHKRSTRVNRHTPGVAFSTYLTAPIHNMAAESVIVFGGVLLNEGMGYNDQTGYFTAPADGVYMFSFFISDTKVEELNVKLVVDGNNVMGAVSEPQHQFQDMQGGNVAMVRLNAGQSVWLSTHGVRGLSLIGSGLYKDCSFSGVLLYQ